MPDCCAPPNPKLGADVFVWDSPNPNAGALEVFKLEPNPNPEVDAAGWVGAPKLKPGAEDGGG